MIYLTSDWDAFDNWCLLHSVDAESLASRQLAAMVEAHLTEGLDKERRAAFLDELEQIGQRVIDQETSEKSSPIPDTAPPPGWRSDEDNWAGIQMALGQMSTIGKAVSRG